MMRTSLINLCFFFSLFWIGGNIAIGQTAVYDFFSTNGLTGPTSTPPCYQITASDPGSAGAAWINYSLTNDPAYVIDLSARNLNIFDQSFQMTFGSNNWGGADGMAFVITDTASSRLGAPGQGLGYGAGATCGATAGNCFIDNSIIFEFDTHPNTGPNDPSDDHIALQLNGTEDHTDPNNALALVTIGDIEDGLIHNMRLRIIPNRGATGFIMDLFFDDMTTPKITHTFTTADIAAIFPDPSTLIWGVTGANGGLTSTQKFGQSNICSTSAFPVEWTYFEGEKQTDGSVKLSWGTASEINNQGFEIERMDAEEWTQIGTISGQGNAHQSNAYEFTDILPKTGFNIYRLRQIDWDGKTTFSPLVELFIEPSHSLSRIFPNPATSHFSLQLPSSQMEGDMTIVYYDLKGQRLVQQQVSVGNGESYIKTQSPELSAGIYMVELQKYGHRVMPPVRLILK